MLYYVVGLEGERPGLGVGRALGGWSFAKGSGRGRRSRPMSLPREGPVDS